MALVLWVYEDIFRIRLILSFEGFISLLFSFAHFVFFVAFQLTKLTVCVFP